MDGLISADVQIFCTGSHLEISLGWKSSVFSRLTIPDDFGLTEFLTFLESFIAPRSRDNVVRSVIRAAEIEREGRKLRGSTALQEKNSIFVGDVQQGTEGRFRILDDREEFFAAVAHFHDAHTARVPVVELGLGLFKDRGREGSRASSEVEDATIREGEVEGAGRGRGNGGAAGKGEGSGGRNGGRKGLAMARKQGRR